MDRDGRSERSRTLVRARSGDASATESLLPLAYAELRALAGLYLGRERADHTLQPTALVHEAWLRLVDAKDLANLDRAHFLGIAAGMMRRILVDHARRHDAQKRGGQGARVTLDGRVAASDGPPDVEILALEEALERLAALDLRQARVVELRFFGGLTMDEVASTLGVSKRSVETDWTLARAWLHRELVPR